MLLTASVLVVGVSARAQEVVPGQGDRSLMVAARSDGSELKEIRPLALKEQMVRDRFQRFEDRVYRLREQLGVTEPDNVSRLGRVLQRAGELGLGDRLDEMIELLRAPSSLDRAFNTQAEWLADVDRLLAILLERDSANEERKREIDRLREYYEKLNKLLEQEQALRSGAAQASMSGRMAEQLDQAIRRIDELLNRQEKLSEQTEQAANKQLEAGAESPPPAPQELSSRQTDLSRDAGQLAEDLHRAAAQSQSGDPGESEPADRIKTAAESVQSGAGAMSSASSSLQKGDTQPAREQQETATDALRQARKELEAAKRELERQEDSKQMAEEQRQVADETGELSDQMRADAAAAGKQGQPGAQKGSSSPGEQSLDQARREMDEAAEALGQSNPGEATPSQDRAIEDLEQAQRELEEALNQLREEQREETLRDLELRFREMLSKQRAINEATVRLDEVGRQKTSKRQNVKTSKHLNLEVDRSLIPTSVGTARWGRAEQLQLADLSTQQRALSQEAATCLHILDEEGTTIVFPRVVGQVSEDMALVADRIAALDVGSLTQTIEREIVDTLEQLLAAVQQMQQENESSRGRPADASGKEPPLLPPSAELKLLRASQVRVNLRTAAIDSARTGKPDQTNRPPTADQAANLDLDQGLTAALQTTASRQKECAVIAKEMRDRQHQP